MNDPAPGDGYHRILFHTAVLVMACDGEIHADELRELQLANQRTGYFTGIDFDSELGRLSAGLEDDKQKVIQEYFHSLGSCEFDIVQRLQIVELVLRIVYADQRVHENEIRFCRMIQRELRVPDSLINQRFGSVPFLSARPNEAMKQSETLSCIAEHLSSFSMEDMRSI
jgi:uncharacterized tellurite resistance protein B-like protein